MAHPVLDTGLIPCLTKALQGPLPGEVAQQKMRVIPPPLTNRLGEGPTPRLGAVLALLYPKWGELHLALTRRCANLKYHGGQVSLPGGAQEDGDASLWETALREAAEEVGIAGDQVTYLGALTPVPVPASGYIVHSFAAYAGQRPAFRLQTDEVEELIELPLSVLLDPRAKAIEEWQLADRVAQVPFYRHGERAIWGATAMILSELEALLARIVARSECTQPGPSESISGARQ